MPSGIPISGKRTVKRTASKITHQNRTQTIDEWGNELGISAKTIRARINRGWSTENALLPLGSANPDRPAMTGKYRQKHKQGEVHRLIAEKLLGKPLPASAEVHHVDGNGLNNEHSNLVICPDKAYHRLLHVRTAALKACGNANYRKCAICKQYDDPENMYVRVTEKNPNGSARHRACHAKSETWRKA